MEKRNNVMEFNMQKISNHTDHKHIKVDETDSLFRRFGLLWIIVISMAFLLSAGSAFGQYGNFTVSPMKVEAKITPGKQIETVINIQNLDTESGYTIDLTLVELTQSKQGEWMIIDPNLVGEPNAPEFGFDLRRLSSCHSWIRLRGNVVNIQPSQQVPVEVTIRVPPRKHGFHTAGILATVRPRPGMTGDLPLSVRFLVPIVIEVETRAIRPKIEATQVGLKFQEASGAGPATTIATMRIENAGGTLSQLMPITRLYAFYQNHWHIVTTTDFEPIRIIPGAILELEADIGRSLPSGRYKIRGELYVDGRRTKPVEKEFEFKGDPSITRVLADAPLDLKPLDMTIDCSPGSLRSQTITVYNASDEAVHIQTASGLPLALQQVVKNDLNLKGSDLDCTSWLQISPQNFTLPGGGGRQNVQVVANLPAGATLACYYSLLALWATYPDGQKAGFKTANIFLNNNLVTVEPEAVGLYVQPQELSESNYLITAKFGNPKAIHLTPREVRAGLIPTSGVEAMTIPRISTYLSGDPSPMLPFEERTFSGTLDLSTVPAGRYFLTGRMEYAAGKRPVLTTRLIDVSIEGERRIIQTVGTQIDLGGAVQVNW
jgi:hypothetical protein